MFLYAEKKQKCSKCDVFVHKLSQSHGFQQIPIFRKKSISKGDLKEAQAAQNIVNFNKWNKIGKDKINLERKNVV